MESDESIALIERTLPDLARRFMGRTMLDEKVALLPIAQFRLVKALPLDDIGETMGHLSEKLGIKASALTQAADRVVRHGLIERISDPDDRRIVRLRLTEAGRKWTEMRNSRRRARLESIWQVLGPDDQKAFVQAVQALDRLGQRADSLLTITKQETRSEKVE